MGTLTTKVRYSEVYDIEVEIEAPTEEAAADMLDWFLNGGGDITDYAKVHDPKLGGQVRQAG